jgi:hypothetical protein
MSERCWIARLDAEPRGAEAAAPLTGDRGQPMGWLVAWRQWARPLLADPRVIDPRGDPAWLSLAWAPDSVDLLFDDGAVQRARQVVLENEPPAAVTTLSRDASHIGGALTARRGADAQRLLADDPFARLMPSQIVRVPAGLVGSPFAPASVVLERYAGKPWPAEGFDPGS